MSALAAWSYGLLIIVGIMSLTWLVQYRTRNASIVDVVWSFSLGFLAVWYAWVSPAAPHYRWLISLLGGIWSVRLGMHLWVRITGKPEDGRYRRLREEWGANQNFRMFGFFQVQAIIAAILSIPFLVIAFRTDCGCALWTGIGIAIWICAVIGEGVADYQLARFSKRPEAHTTACRDGLWRYSRHPNYFFEWLHWFAYVFIAIGAPYWWATLIGPVIMLWLLVKVTGIPYTEQQIMSGARRESYQQYQQTTNSFIPWFPKKGK